MLLSNGKGIRGFDGHKYAHAALKLLQILAPIKEKKAKSAEKGR